MEHPIFNDRAEQLTMLTALLDSFPGQEGAPDVRVPIHPRVRQAWAKELIKRGVVVVPDLMKQLPVPTGDHPEAGWLQPMEWVKREDYEARRAQTPPSSEEQQTGQMRQMLAVLDPDLEQKIRDMSDPEKREEMARMATQIPKHLDAVRAAMEHLQKTRTHREEPDG
ncbi:hypothetical protein [Nocardia otitidiscaviarum]|uniref:hypothetical protein n=1 Tax=Nocardia otitidiscaviarum TaxID=1823 RepID=UPI0004A70722|nr:hypothetical protein [Nocardia otitidiscaviarum]